MTDALDFDSFFIEHYDRLVRSLNAIVGDADRAHDCAQEAFIKAYARWGSIGRYDSPIHWVRKVAINGARDIARSERRRRRREDRYEAEPATPTDATDDVAAQIDVVSLLHHLTDRQRTVAALFYLEDIPVAEIALSTGLSQGAVKFHLNKARGALRVLMGVGGER
ncbi:MAG: sigma-70 family RNA polymerase sigma factor [Actinomycetia bacterium]|nr:sigma-70 family RNA polymerase sigma factor [Actinomycetes bacterium]